MSLSEDVRSTHYKLCLAQVFIYTVEYQHASSY